MHAVTGRISVLVVDDHPLLRAGLLDTIADQLDMRLVGEAADGEDAVRQFARLRPDVTVMDVAMPGMDGVQALREIRAMAPDARVVMLTTFSGDVQIRRAIDAGAAGFLLKNSVRKDLIDTIRDVHAGRRRIAPEVAQALADNIDATLLSEREIAVLSSVALGNANKRVAIELDITEETVKSHMRNILNKLGARDRTHAVTIALKRGMIAL
ncbi:LuxR family transcriptional regulator [Massilia sp. JS1662]|nr:LuxR family transcriptional regulator [Massilia sp. JS1662]